jgi:peptidoglycan/xylan/chitin deacetylase (PgdA/CDA1 family)
VSIAFASFRGALGGLRARLRRPTGDGIVLCYHRLAESSFDPWSLCVTPRNFEQHLKCVLRYGEPVPASEIAAVVARRRRGPASIAITFDDGYADNVLEGRPLFERLGIPVTIFLATGFVGSDRELWWDELERAVVESPRLPPSLELDVGGRVYKKTLASDDLSERAALYEDLYWHIRPLGPSVRDRVLADLLAWAGSDVRARPGLRLLSRDEVRRASATGGITFGAHTQSHPVLALLGGEAQQREVAGSKADVEGMTGRPVACFAYPHGRAADYTAETVETVRAAGFTHAFTTSPGAVTPAAEPFELPRVCVENLDGGSFRTMLREWLR